MTRRAYGVSRRRALLAAALCSATLVVVPIGSTANSSPLFTDSFESGDFRAWTVMDENGDGRARVQATVVRSGSRAARLSASGAAGSSAYLRRTLGGSPLDVVIEGSFRVDGEGAANSNVPLLRVLDAGGQRQVSLYRQNQTGGAVWISAPGLAARTTTPLPLRAWSDFELTLTAGGPGKSTIEVRQDGATTYRTQTATLSPAGFPTVQIGQEVGGQAFDLFIDDITLMSTSVPRPTTTTTSTTTTTVPAPTTTTMAPTTTTMAPTTTSAPPPTTTTTRPPAPTTTRPPTTSTTRAPAPPPPPPPPPAGGTLYPGYVAPANPGGSIWYHVSQRGNDANSGTSASAPWRTLERASQAPVRPGDRIVLERGASFTGRLKLTASGTAALPIVVGAYGEGGRPQVTGNCVEVAGSRWVVSQLDVHHCAWAGVDLIGSSNRVEDNLVRDNITGVAVRATARDNRIMANQILNNNRMSVNTNGPKGDDSGAFGVLLHGVATEVGYNTISGSDAHSYDYGRDGAAVEIFGARWSNIHHNRALNNLSFTELGQAGAADNTFAYNEVRSSLPNSDFVVTRGPGSFGPVLRTTLLNNTVVLTGSGSEGFICTSGCGPDILTVRNNIIVTGLKVGYSDRPIDEDNNLYWGGIRQFVVGPNSLVANPLFANVGAGELWLGGGSPAVDRGWNTPYTNDLGWKTLPRDGNGDGVAKPDLGAHEAG